MSPKPQITLSIPALFQPLELWKKDFRFDVTSNYFSLLLTSLEFIDVQKVQGQSACFFSTHGWVDAEIPASSYRALVQFDHTLGSFLNNDTYSIMCADPVHLEVGMKDVTLTERVVDLTEADAKEVIALLNQHFQADSLHFLYGSNQHWYVVYPKSESIRTTPLEDVINKNIGDSLPFSKQRNWQQIQNEIQMLLHSIDVNKRRETTGLIALNSLWFWGGGEPKKIKSDLEIVFSSDENLNSEIQGKMMAQAVNCNWQKLPTNGEELLTHLYSKTGKYLVLLDQLQQPAREENLDAYQAALTRVEEHYIKPLMQAWKNNQIDLVIDAADGSLIRPLKSPVWKFWNKPRPLSDIAAMIKQKKLC